MEVNVEHEVFRNPPVPPVELESLRAKSSLRLKYEAETEVIKRKLGDLEAIRSQLGLSQRKMAQLLLVDPSAWTRWTRGGETAPPHVYRMLQWYLALEGKYPALDVNFWLKTVAQIPDQLVIPAMKAELQTAHSRSSKLEEQLERLPVLLMDSVRFEMDMREKRMQRMLIWAVAGIGFAASAFSGAILLLT